MGSGCIRTSHVFYGGFATWYYYAKISDTYANSPTVTAKNTAKKTTTTDTTTPTKTASPLSYTNATYGFSMEFPATWKGYKFKEAKLEGMVMTYYVELPSSDASFAAGDSTADAGYYSPFAISVYTLEQWDEVAGVDGPHDTLITKSDKYAFAWSPSNGVPASDFTEQMQKDIAGIIASFKLM